MIHDIIAKEGAVASDSCVDKVAVTGIEIDGGSVFFRRIAADQRIDVGRLALRVVRSAAEILCLIACEDQVGKAGGAVGGIDRAAKAT